MLQQTILGIFNLSLPILVGYQWYPKLVTSVQGRLLYALLLGAYLYYLNKKATETMTSSLRFNPTETWKEELTALLRSCNVEPHKVVLKYAYASENIAMAANKTVILDPVLWSTIQADPEAQKVVTIFHKSIEPGLSDIQKNRLIRIQHLLTPAAQRFIFRHEVGHVVAQFYQKKLMAIFFVGFCTTLCALQATAILLPVSGLLALSVGMIIGGILDIVFTYFSNFTFKVNAEYQADRFAACHSTAEEIEAAALFFEQHEEILEKYKDTNTSWLSRLSSSLRTGHPQGAERAKYLRTLLSKQENSK